MPAETRLPLRQQIFNAVRNRFELIHQNNGYATNVGTHCFGWRDTERHKWTEEELTVGCINIADPEREPGDGVLSAHDQILTIEVEAHASCDSGSTPDDHCRRIEADILTAIGVDRQWTVSSVKLAKDTLQGRSSIGVGHLGDRVASVKLTFQILFRTRQFDPYTQ